MAEMIQNGQNNYGWNLTWKMSGRYPVVADRTYPTLADAQAYVDDITSNACVGVIITVNRDENKANNGAYRIDSYASQAGEKGVLHKLGSDLSLSMAKVVPTEDAPLPANVKEAYQLVDDEGNAYGVQIPVYKDSSLQGVGLVTKDANGVVEGEDGYDATTGIKQYMRFTYLTTEGSENVVDLDVSQFLVEAEFDQEKGLAVNNGVVSVKLSTDAETAKWLQFETAEGDNKGALKLVGLTEAIADAKKVGEDAAKLVDQVGTLLGTPADAPLDPTTPGNEDATAFSRIANLYEIVSELTGGSTSSVGAQITSAINELDAEVTSENGSMLNVKVTQADGKITGVEIVGEQPVELTGTYDEEGAVLSLNGFTISDVQA